MCKYAVTGYEALSLFDDHFELSSQSFYPATLFPDNIISNSNILDILLESAVDYEAFSMECNLTSVESK